MELTKRRKRQAGTVVGATANSTAAVVRPTVTTEPPYCFVPSRPFKMPAILRRSHSSTLFRNVMSNVGEVGGFMKRMAGTTLTVQVGK